jgi:hypothetical protein
MINEFIIMSNESIIMINLLFWVYNIMCNKSIIMINWFIFTNNQFSITSN